MGRGVKERYTMAALWPSLPYSSHGVLGGPLAGASQLASASQPTNTH